jgi:hypothetical protein
MARRYKATESRFLRAADLPVGARYRIRIQHTTVEVLGNAGEERERDVLHFAGVPGGAQIPEIKPLVLNVTNSQTLEALFGLDPDACRDQEVELRIGLTNFPNPGTHSAVIEAPTRPVAASPSPPPRPEPPAASTRPKRKQEKPVGWVPGPELDDEIPLFDKPK